MPLKPVIATSLPAASRTLSGSVTEPRWVTRRGGLPGAAAWQNGAATAAKQHASWQTATGKSRRRGME